MQTIQELEEAALKEIETFIKELGGVIQRVPNDSWPQILDFIVLFKGAEIKVAYNTYGKTYSFRFADHNMSYNVSKCPKTKDIKEPNFMHKPSKRAVGLWLKHLAAIAPLVSEHIASAKSNKEAAIAHILALGGKPYGGTGKVYRTSSKHFDFEWDVSQDNCVSTRLTMHYESSEELFLRLKDAGF